MDTITMQAEIKKQEKGQSSKIDSCLGASKGGIRHQVAALSFCGMPEGATEFECNWCGSVHPFAEAVAVNWKGAACIVSEHCQQAEMIKL